MASFLKLFQKAEDEGTLPNIKARKGRYKKRKLRDE